MRKDHLIDELATAYDERAKRLDFERLELERPCRFFRAREFLALGNLPRGESEGLG